jgi:hypothetical protein
MSATAGNTDHIGLFGISPSNVSFVPLDTGTMINIAVSGGTAVIFVAHANIADVQNHISFF